MFVFKGRVDAEVCGSGSFFSNEIFAPCVKMSVDLDLLGFTRQTETLLCGVGAQSLIKEFKRRNISSDALHKLTKKDFIQLGNMVYFDNCVYCFMLACSTYREI